MQPRALAAILVMIIFVTILGLVIYGVSLLWVAGNAVTAAFTTAGFLFVLLLLMLSVISHSED